MSSSPTAADVARWMTEELSRAQYLYQDVVVSQICDLFGEQFTIINSNGNMAIRKDVLADFRKLTGELVVWDRGSRYWRKREDYDTPGRRQT